MTHFLKLLDNMRKHEMDPTSIVEDTEHTVSCPQMDRWAEGPGETSVLLTTSLKRGIKIYKLFCH